MRIFVILLLTLLSACSRGPEQQTLEADLRQRLAQAFPADTLSLVELQRRGSAHDVKATDDERVLIYFDAELQLNRDLNFGSWDAPGVASLISALGAGPRGVSGIESGGNRKGDRIKAHGSLIYQHKEGHWQPVAAQGFTAPRAPEISNTSSPREALVQAIGTALNLSPEGTSNAERQVINQELERSLINIQGRLARLQNGYPMAAGPESGQYAKFARALSSAVRGQGVSIQPLTTQGGLENLQLLRSGDAALALSQSDTAFLAASGQGPFANTGPDSSLRALASLYPEPVHVLVRADSNIKQISELRGRRVNLGSLGSASRDTALAVLHAEGLEPTDLMLVSDMDLQKALVALQAGELDALIQVIGSPADHIRAAGETFALRLLPLDEAAVQGLQKSRPGTFAYRLPQGSYPWQREAVNTLAVSSLLLGSQRLTNGEVEALVQQLFKLDRQWLQYGSIQGGQLSLDNALRGLGVPLHEGAERALQALRR